MQKEGKLIVFSAPSGSGKTTIVRHLLGLEDLNLEFSISAASRVPRGEEVNGKEYYFISTEQFKKHIKGEDFLECIHKTKQVNHNLDYIYQNVLSCYNYIYLEI